MAASGQVTRLDGVPYGTRTRWPVMWINGPHAVRASAVFDGLPSPMTRLQSRRPGARRREARGCLPRYGHFRHL